MEKEQLHDAAAATRSCTEAKRAVAGESQREILLALPLMTIRFLHMGFAFRRNSRHLASHSRQRMQKKINSELKMQKSVIFRTRSIAANSIAGLSRFCDISAFCRERQNLLESRSGAVLRRGANVRLAGNSAAIAASDTL